MSIIQAHARRDNASKVLGPQCGGNIVNIKSAFSRLRIFVLSVLNIEFCVDRGTIWSRQDVPLVLID